MPRTILVVPAVLALALAGSLALAGDGPTGGTYPLATCPVSGMPLGKMGKPVILVHEGREIRFCCKGCLPKFEAEPAKYLKEIDTAIVKDQTPRYPLDTCVVSGKKLGENDRPPVDLVVGNRLFRLCCGGCVRKVREDPAAYVAKLDAAVVKARKEDYPLDTCVISGGKLGGMGEPVDYVHAGRLVRFCCAGCIPKFRKDPLTALAKIDAEAAKRAGEGAAADEDSDSDGESGEGCGGSCGGGCCGGR
jgi:YHS domain-containing protein